MPEGSLSCDRENGTVLGEDYTGAFTNTFDGDKDGTWTFNPQIGLTRAPAYLAVKASTDRALYSLDGALSGDWTTEGILNNGDKQPGISHLSFYNSVAQAPLPATVWMMIAGLGGLGAVSRRRKVSAA